MKSMSFVDPNQFVITRRRKKYKFALFNNSPLCFEYDEWTPRPIDVLEIGAGTGLFSVELAARHPEQRFLAVDVKADRLQKGAREAERRGLTNIWFVRARADQLGELCEAGSLSQLWITFPDPFPRQRSSGRRLTHPHFLTQYAKLLNEGGELLLKHDDHGFFCWSSGGLARGRRLGLCEQSTIGLMKAKVSPHPLRHWLVAVEHDMLARPHSINRVDFPRGRKIADVH